MKEDIEVEFVVLDTHLKVSFSIDQLWNLRAPWSKMLMAIVLGSKIRYDARTQWIPLLWKPQGKLDIIDIGKHFFLFKFNLQSNLERIILGGPWFVFGHYLMLTPWGSSFQNSQNPFSFMTVWVRLPELVVEYFNKLALFDIGKLVGVPIKVDFVTYSAS